MSYLVNTSRAAMSSVICMDSTSPSSLWPCQSVSQPVATRTLGCRLTSTSSLQLIHDAADRVRAFSSRCRHNSRLRLVTPAAAQPPTTDQEDEAEGSTRSRQESQDVEQQDVASGSSSSSGSRSSGKQQLNTGRSGPGSSFSIDDPQLLVGDCVALVAAACYRQIAAIVLSPTFPGWLAPLSFNPLRFVEFANFASMLVASWVVAATLTGGYSGTAVGAGVPGALRAVCRAWLVAMPICAAHLVLVTASESQALVGDEGFAGVLPLAAAGPGEPLGTAAALLGLMAMWRAFYAVYLDTWAWASHRDVAEDAARFREALASVALVAAGCSLLLQVLQLTATLPQGQVV